jgi:outer membrane protein
MVFCCDVSNSRKPLFFFMTCFWGHSSYSQNTGLSILVKKCYVSHQPLRRIDGFMFLPHRIFLISLVFPLLIVSIVSAADSGSESTVVDLTLDKVISYVLKGNRSILQTRNNLQSARFFLDSKEADFSIKAEPFASYNSNVDINAIKTSEAGIDIKKKLDFGPTITLGPRVSRFQGDNILNEYESGVSLSVEIPLLKGFGRAATLDGVDSAEYAMRGSRVANYLNATGTALSAIRQFYNIRKQGLLIARFEDLARHLDEHARIARVKEKVDLANTLDIYRAEIQLKNAQNQLELAIEAFSNAEDELKKSMSLPLGTTLKISAPLDIQPMNTKEAEAIEIAMANRIELKQGENDIAEATRSSKVARNNLLPEVNLVTTYKRFGRNEIFSDSIDISQNLWSIGLQGRADLFHHAETSNYQRSLVGIQNSRIILAETRDRIASETRAQLRRLAKTQEQIKLRKEQKQQALGKLSVSQAKFDYGMATNFDVIEAESEVNQSETELITATIDYIVGVYEFRSVVGTLLSYKEFGL